MEPQYKRLKMLSRYFFLSRLLSFSLQWRPHGLTMSCWYLSLYFTLFLFCSLLSALLFLSLLFVYLFFSPSLSVYLSTSFSLTLFVYFSLTFDNLSLSLCWSLLYYPYLSRYLPFSMVPLWTDFLWKMWYSRRVLVEDRRFYYPSF